LPAVNAAREAARRNAAINNLRQLGLGLLNYESANGHFPARAIADSDGKRLLSWRVAILPYLEQSALYDQFHLDESWDSPHNLKLASQMPAVFASPGHEQDGKTNYQMPVAEGTAFFNQQDEPKLQNFKDGTSHTILLVESDRFVPWTRPDDHEVDWKQPLADLGGLRLGGFPVVFADCHSAFIPYEIADDRWTAWLTSAGGEADPRP
jgi:hypothetical protein